MSNHKMITRSKSNKNKDIIDNPFNDDDNNDEIDEYDEVDEFGNLKGFIDYDCHDEFDHREFDKQLNRIKGTKPKKKKLKNKNKNKNINDILVSYLIMKATDKANKDLKNRKNNKNNKNKIKIREIEQDNIVNESSSNITILNADLEETDSDDSSFKSIETNSSSGDDTIISKDNINNNDDDDEEEKNNESNDEEDEEDEEYSFEYDNLDEKYEELIDKHALLNSEESNMEYYHYLPKEKKEYFFRKTKEIYDYNGKNIPLRFKVIDSEMDMKTKAIALENIDKLSEMDVSTGEHSKMDNWINGLMKIPFGKYNTIPIDSNSTINDKKSYIQDTYKTLNKAIYGHKEAKTHILQIIGKWIKNPNSGGNVLAIQGPMGNGKTTLVKEGISKVLNRPFAFIALGGASDSAFFDGHCFTYEGSHWGRIVQILHDSKCMNPVFYFDELDKLSDTAKGDEITHMLTHLTDPSQNSLFQDNYFPGINLDLSKALFIFSYNDESKVNKILKDRMYVIHTKGFNIDDKLKITRDYLLPDIYNTFMFNDNDFIISDDIIKNIIKNYTSNEEGVRNLKRCLETIISKINIHILSEGDSELSFNLNDISLPLEIKDDHIEILLKTINNNDKPPFGMYC
jgi:ATP-dependent Lon protease